MYVLGQPQIPSERSSPFPVKTIALPDRSSVCDINFWLFGSFLGSVGLRDLSSMFCVARANIALLPTQISPSEGMRQAVWCFRSGHGPLLVWLKDCFRSVSRGRLRLSKGLCSRMREDFREIFSTLIPPLFFSFGYSTSARYLSHGSGLTRLLDSFPPIVTQDSCLSCYLSYSATPSYWEESYSQNLSAYHIKANNLFELYDIISVLKLIRACIRIL